MRASVLGADDTGGGEEMTTRTLRKTMSCSIYPQYICKSCGKELWLERSDRTGWREWLVTKQGKHHYKTRCNLSEERGDKK
jgi:hypothetical protein